MSFNYIKVDKEKINVEKDYSVSYYDLLDPNKAKDRDIMVEFLKENDASIFNDKYASEMDYYIFVGCMEIYNNTGVNYFDDFKLLYLYNNHCVLNKGIKNYSKSWDCSRHNLFDEDFFYDYLEKVRQIITLMNFFGIEKLKGSTIEEYINHYNNAEKDWQEMKYEMLKERESKKLFNQTVATLNYFNFDNFDNVTFEKIFNKCIKDISINKNIYTLDETINMNINLAPNKTFIVFLRKDDKVCFIGKTKNLLNYMGAKYKEYNADGISFFEVDNEFIDDIYVKALSEFNIIAGGLSKSTNKKYITMTMLKKAFKEIYNINLIHIRKILSKYDIEQFTIGDVVFVNKIELDKATREYLNLEPR